MGRTILITLCILALGWIGYVSVTLVSTGNKITPETVFSPNESTIVVIHRFEEIDLKADALAFLSKNRIFGQLLVEPERIQHFYFSSKGEKILAERSKPWTIKLITNYFNKLNIGIDFSGARSFQLANGWEGRYDKVYLLIYKKDTYESSSNSIQWDYVDRKSSYSVISKKGMSYSIDNIYNGIGNTINYQSDFNSPEKTLVNDQELFQDVIPSNFSNYQFFSKKYLQHLNPSESIIYDWINYGICRVQIGNQYCLISDQLPGQDPLAILGDAVTISSNGKSGQVANETIPKQLLGKGTKSWYIEVFNSRVFIAKDQEIVHRIIGDYEVGKTLAQDLSLRSNLFQSAPKRVSYREINGTNHTTKSELEFSTLTYTFNTGQKEKTDDSEEEKIEKETIKALSTLRIEGGIAEILPIQNSATIIVRSNSNTVMAVQNGQIIWKQTIEGETIGELQSELNGSIHLTTKTGFYNWNSNGDPIVGFPLKLNGTIQSEGKLFSWKRKDQIAIVMDDYLHIYTLNGRLQQQISLKTKMLHPKVEIWVNRGELTASILDDKRIMQVSIDRKRIRQDIGLSDVSTSFLFKKNDQPDVICLQKGELQVRNFKGELLQTIATNIDKFLSIEKQGATIQFIAQKGGQLTVLDLTGKTRFNLNQKLSSVDGASWNNQTAFKTRFAVLDGLSNEIQLFDNKGSNSYSKTLEGGIFCYFHLLNSGKVQLITQSNNYLLCYPIN